MQGGTGRGGGAGRCPQWCTHTPHTSATRHTPHVPTRGTWVSPRSLQDRSRAVRPGMWASPDSTSAVSGWAAQARPRDRSTNPGSSTSGLQPPHQPQRPQRPPQRMPLKQQQRYTGTTTTRATAPLFNTPAGTQPRTPAGTRTCTTLHTQQQTPHSPARALPKHQMLPNAVPRVQHVPRTPCAGAAPAGHVGQLDAQGPCQALQVQQAAVRVPAAGCH